MHIRQAQRDGAARLSDIAFRAKASWGYDAAFMAAARAELTVSRERIDRQEIFCVGHDASALGFAAIRQVGAILWLDDLFVDPNYHRRGLGLALIEHVLALARDRGAEKVSLHADPHAQIIYDGWDFKTVGFAPSASIPGRLLPIMERSV